MSLGEWGAAWLEIAPEHLDPFVALWSMCNLLRRDRPPGPPSRHQLHLHRPPEPERYWLLIENGDTEICKEYPGLDEDLYITAEAEAFVKWHAGRLLGRSVRDQRIRLHGPSWLVRAFPTWNARSASCPHQAGSARRRAGCRPPVDNGGARRDPRRPTTGKTACRASG